MARQMKDSGIAWIGEIPENWRVIKLKYCTYIRARLGWRGLKAEEYEESGYPLLSAFNIINNKLDFTEVNYINQERYDESPEIKLTQNDILLVKDGAGIGKCAIVDHLPLPSTPNGSLAVITVTDCFEPKFLYYYFLSVVFQRYIDRIKNGMGVPHLFQSDIKEIRVVTCDRVTQRRIADFLDRRCAEIDAVIEHTKATIEEYKKLKQAVITEAVTKGVRGARKMKDSGIKWVADIVDTWEMSRVGLHYSIVLGKMLCDKQLTEEYTLEPYFCAANIHFDGVSQEQLKQMWFSPAEKISYRVQNGDLLVVEGGAGAGGAAIVEILEQETFVQNSVMIVRGLSGQTNRYLRYWIECLVKRGYVEVVCNKATIPHFTKDKLATMPVPVVPIDEMEEIADYLDQKCTALDTLIAKKTALLTELETYKKSLIYEYVTGKRECLEAVQEETVIEYPLYPATVNTQRLRFAQAMLMAKILDMHGKGMGRVKLEKMLYTIETSIGFDFDTEYVREAAGPLHESIYKCEGIISRQNHWYQLHQSQYGVSYTPKKDARKYKAYYDKYFSAYNAEIERIIGIFKPYNTDQAEVVATLFAAWNDAVIAGKPYTDEDVVDDVLNNWHESKKRYPKEMWLRAMAQMRKDELVPKGYGRRTVIKES